MTIQNSATHSPKQQAKYSRRWCCFAK